MSAPDFEHLKELAENASDGTWESEILFIRNCDAATIIALCDAASEAEALRAEVERLKKDAERYRWLNGPESEWEPFETAWLNKFDIYGQRPEDMDAVIDAAIAASKQTDGGAGS